MAPGYGVMHIVVGTLPPEIISAVEALIDRAGGGDSDLLFMRQAVPADRMPAAKLARRAAAQAAAERLIPGDAPRLYVWYLHGYALNTASSNLGVFGYHPPAGPPEEEERVAFAIGLFDGKDGRESKTKVEFAAAFADLIGAAPAKAAAAAPKVGIHINIVCACGKALGCNLDSDVETAGDLKRALINSMGWRVEGPPGTGALVTTCPACLAAPPKENP